MGIIPVVLNLGEPEQVPVTVYPITSEIAGIFVHDLFGISFQVLFHILLTIELFKVRQFFLARADIDQEELGLVPAKLCPIAVNCPSNFVCLHILTLTVEPLFRFIPVFRTVLLFEVVHELTATPFVLCFFLVRYIDVHPIKFFNCFYKSSICFLVLRISSSFSLAEVIIPKLSLVRI